MEAQVIERKEITDVIPNLEKFAWSFVPREAETIWTARAIWKSFEKWFDVLPDRQACDGEIPKRQELVEWLNKTGLKLLNKAFLDNGIRQVSDEYVIVKDGKFSIMGTPNSSHGYAYISAWIN
jgi:hypothetical protein